MVGERYTQEFKIAAVKQITPEGHSISSGNERLKSGIRRLSVSTISFEDEE